MGLALPGSWRDRFSGYGLDIDATGRSAAETGKLSAPGKPALFLKREPRGPFAELPAEIEKLRWLAARGMPAPAVIDTAEEGGFHYLLMSALPGSDLATAQLSPAMKVDLAAAALRRLHEVPIAVCPFDGGIPQTIKLAESRLAAGLVDESDFDGDNLGRTGAELLAILKATIQQQVDAVVTHGDATLANMIADGEIFSGFIDCGRLGVADRYRDLAIAARDIAELGASYTARFFAAYGLDDIDAERLAFYRLADEFL